MKKHFIKTVTFTCSYKDYKGKSWQDSYFHLLSWRNTWYRAIELDMLADTNNQPFVLLVVKEKDAEAMASLLENYGYNFKQENTKTLEVLIDYDETQDADGMIINYL